MTAAGKTRHPRSATALSYGFRQWRPYWAMLPGIVFFLLWHYVPIWSAKMAFEQVRIIPPNIWVGMKNFHSCCCARWPTMPS